MNVIETPSGTLKALRRRAAGSFQRTFATPLKRLPAFVGAVLGETAPIRSASAFVESIVFAPKHLETLLKAHGLPKSYVAEWTIAAEGQEESAALLEALLADWIDFYFAPEPKHILLYADHDEYTTLFALKKGPLSRAADRLKAIGVREITDYARAI